MRPETHSLYQADAIGLLERFDAGQFTLAYLDPPWATTDVSEAELQVYREFISRLVQQCWRVLNDRGTLYFHAPPVSHTDFRLILSQTFNRPPSSVIIWKYQSHAGGRRGISDNHEDILRYVRSPQAIFHMVKTPSSLEQYRLHDEIGPYRLVDVTMPIGREPLQYAWNGGVPPEGRSWRFSLPQMQQYQADGRLITCENGWPRLKQYFDESLGRDLGSVWDDIPAILPAKRLYPSEKPAELCNRLIRQATNEGDWVLDPLCGSGQVLVQSQKLGRCWVGCDIAPAAIAASQGLFEREFGPNALRVVTEASIATQARVSTEYKNIFLEIPELDHARQGLARLVGLTAMVRTVLSQEQLGDEEVFAVLLDILPRMKWLVSESAHKEAEAELRRLLPSFPSLEVDSQEFLITGLVVFYTLPDGMDAAVVSVSVWKAVENEINSKILTPFRDWMVRRNNDLIALIASDSKAENAEWERIQLAGYLKKAKLPPLGVTVGILNKCANSKKTIQASPSLKGLKEYIEAHFADASFVLSPQGLLSILSQEKIDRYRNGAAHTTAFTKDRAKESFEFVIEALLAMADGLRAAT
jgi:DNA modification methylase